MKGKMENRHVAQQGFTLIEILIVLIIIGILAAVAIPYYINMQKEAKIAVVKGKLSAIRGGIEIVHAKILLSGSNSGPGGDNPDWPTVEEVQANELMLATRPESIRFLRIVRTENLSSEPNLALPPCLLPNMTPGMAALQSGVTGRSLEHVNVAIKRASEETGWAYYPGNEKDSKGRVVSAMFYVNDDRAETDNIDGNGKVPSQW